MRALLLLSSLVCLTAASPLLLLEKTVHGRAVAVTPQDLENFKFVAEFAASAYCNSDAPSGTPVACGNDACPAVMADGAVVWASLDGNTSSNMEGYVAVDPDRSLIVVSLRGTQSVRNFAADLLFLQVPCTLTAGCLVHAGFELSWSQIARPVLAAVSSAAAAHPGFAVVVTGHSLGGAVGHLAAAALRAAGVPCDLYTYGSPRVGNLALAKFLTAQPGAEYRVTHADDPVPRLPPILFNYRHTSPEYWVYSADEDDIKVCEGAASVKCNAGQAGFDVAAHSQYFGDIGACAPGGATPFRRADLNETEIAARVDEYARLDWEFAAKLEEEGGE